MSGTSLIQTGERDCSPLPGSLTCPRRYPHTWDRIVSQFSGYRGAVEDAPSPSHDHPPVFGMLSDERLHQLLALGVLQIDDFDASRSERFLAPDEGGVFAPG